MLLLCFLGGGLERPLSFDPQYNRLITHSDADQSLSIIRGCHRGGRGAPASERCGSAPAGAAIEISPQTLVVLTLHIECYMKTEGSCAAGEVAVHLLERLLAFDPERRASADEALAHEYFAGMESELPSPDPGR